MLSQEDEETASAGAEEEDELEDEETASVGTPVVGGMPLPSSVKRLADSKRNASSMRALHSVAVSCSINNKKLDLLKARPHHT